MTWHCYRRQVVFCLYMLVVIINLFQFSKIFTVDSILNILLDKNIYYVYIYNLYIYAYYIIDVFFPNPFPTLKWLLPNTTIATKLFKGEAAIGFRRRPKKCTPPWWWRCLAWWISDLPISSQMGNSSEGYRTQTLNMAGVSIYIHVFFETIPSFWERDTKKRHVSMNHEQSN